MKSSRAKGQATQPGSSRGLALAASLGIVRVASWLAPSHEREVFRRQWAGELSFAARAAQTSGRSLLRRSLLSLRDAVTLQTRRARGDGPAGATPPGGSRPRPLDDLLQDLRFAMRSLWHARGFAAVAIATMAIGIGSTTTIFSLVDGILLRPLPYPESERLVVVWPEMYFSSRLFDAIEPELDAYEAISGYQNWEHTWLAEDGAVRVQGPSATAALFDVLNVPMVRGRGFAVGEDAPGSTAIVVTERFWRGRLGSRDDVVGLPLRLDGVERVVVGVVGEELDALSPRAEVVLPWILDADDPGYGSQELKLLGRLRPGIAEDTALAELKVFAEAIRQQYELPEDFGDDAAVVSLQEYLVGDSRAMLLLLFGAVGVTLLIAAANVANLLLTRAVSRQREIAVRVALGAGGGRLARQILTETTVLGLLAAVPGLALAVYGLRAVVALLPADTPRLEAVGLDASALLFSCGVALATGWVVGLGPALHAARADVREALAAGGRAGSDSRGRQRLRRGIVLAEIALAVTLVASAGLLVKSLLRLSSVDPGFRPEGLVTFQVDPAAGTVSSAAQAHQYYTQIQRRIEAIPGVTGSTSVWKVAFSEDGGLNGFYRADVPIDPSTDAKLVRWRPVQGNYLETVGIRLRQGRFFGPEDRGGEPVVVVSEAAARALFPGEDPIGKRVLTTAERGLELRIVGVVEDLKLAGLDRDAPSVAYRPYLQIDEAVDRHGFWSRWIVVRTQGAAAPGMATAIREALRAEDPTALFADYVTMPGAIRSSLATRQALVILLAFFALSAVTLGAIGIYGVMAHAVRQRKREIGIRAALGATRGRIVTDVLRDGLGVAVAGAVVGLLLTGALARVVTGFLFEVDPLDPWILGAAASSAMLIALTASLWPAIHAARSDPAAALTSGD
jgi:predicted permease